MEKLSLFHNTVFLVHQISFFNIYDVMLITGPFPVSSEKQAKLTGMDPQVLIDALAVIMGHEEKELCKPGHLALVLLHETAATILGSKEKVCPVLSSSKDYLLISSARSIKD